MLVSVTRLLRLALPMLLGVLFLSLSGDPSPAQAPGLLALRGTPGQVRETIAPAATVIDTFHYQAQLIPSCLYSACSGDLPRPGHKRRLNVTRMSCLLVGTAGSTFSYGFLELRTADGLTVQYQWLPVDHSASDGLHTLNRAVDMQVGSNQHIRVTLILASGTAHKGFCTATGTLDVLQ